MSLIRIKEFVSENNGSLYNYNQEGFLVLDCTGRYIKWIPPLDSNNTTDDVIQQLQFFFSSEIHANRNISNERISFEKITCLDVDLYVCADLNQQTNFLTELENILIDKSIILRFHFNAGCDDCVKYLSPIVKTFHDLINKSHLTLQLHGFFESIKGYSMEFLFNNHIQLYHVDNDLEFSSFSQNAVKDLAEFGFRVPIVWYVSSQNIDSIITRIDESMAINYNSGFSLPLASESLFNDRPKNPSQSKYLKLLTEVYKKYPFYDDVLYPLNFTHWNSLVGRPCDQSSFYRWNYESKKISIAPLQVVSDQVKLFFFRLFLWQRWIVLSLSNKESCP
jgi:hypothetical protein